MNTDIMRAVDSKLLARLVGALKGYEYGEINEWTASLLKQAESCPILRAHRDANGGTYFTIAWVAEGSPCLTAEQILQAVARGWAHPANSRKHMDPELGEAIAAEIFDLVRAAPSAPVKPEAAQEPQQDRAPQGEAVDPDDEAVQWLADHLPTYEQLQRQLIERNCQLGAANAELATIKSNAKNGQTILQRAYGEVKATKPPDPFPPSASIDAAQPAQREAPQPVDAREEALRLLKELGVMPEDYPESCAWDVRLVPAEIVRLIALARAAAPAPQPVDAREEAPINLPPLPEHPNAAPDIFWTNAEWEAMQAYARAAVLADRASAPQEAAPQPSQHSQTDAWQPAHVPEPKGLHTNPDAMAWADYWAQTFPGQAHMKDLMHTWFANAMMAMHDASAPQTREGDCPICGGSQHPSGKVCACGGSGNAADAVTYLLGELHDLRTAAPTPAQSPAGVTEERIEALQRELAEEGRMREKAVEDMVAYKRRADKAEQDLSDLRAREKHWQELYMKQGEELGKLVARVRNALGEKE